MNLDVWDWSTGNGGDFRQYDAHGGYNQQFSLVPVSGGSSSSVDGFAAISGSDGLSTTTGGCNVTATVVYSCSELIVAVTDSSPRVIHIPAPQLRDGCQC